jgi:hypothetical protein
MSKKITFSLEISDEDYEALVKRGNHYRDKSKDAPMDVFLRARLWGCRYNLLNTFQISNYDVVIE